MICRERTAIVFEGFILDNYTHFEHLSVTGGIGVIVLDTGGRTLFESSVHAAASYFLETLYEKLDYGESSRVAFLYGCYQARRPEVGRLNNI